MPSRAALLDAIELARTPRLARKLRSQPLPDGVELLLQIAAGNRVVLTESAALLQRSAESLQNAAVFYVVQILLHSESDDRRALGATPTASRDQLRSNFSLLMKWLHPDVIREEAFAVYARRVIRAWQDLEGASPQRDKATDLPPARPRPKTRPDAVGIRREPIRKPDRLRESVARLGRSRQLRGWVLAALALGLAMLASSDVWPASGRPLEVDGRGRIDVATVPAGAGTR